MNEIFKDIKDFEGLYQVSNLGNVKSLPKGDGNGKRERILKPSIDTRKNTQYARVTLSKQGKTRRFLVHRLVAETFVDNSEDKPYINHIDNNGLNNSTKNLEWCTHTENMVHSSNQGRQDIVRSKGGKASAKLAYQKAVRKWTTYVGTTIGDLTVIGFKYDNELKIPKFKLVCKCTCGNKTENTYSNIMKSMKMCKECSYKYRKIKI